MDKQSLIGLGLIASILGVWLYFSGPSKEQIARNKQVRDSIEIVERNLKAIEAAKIAALPQPALDTLKQTNVVSDSVKAVLANDTYKDFAPATLGAKETFTIENKNIIAHISNKGGQIEKVELKNYQRPGSESNLVLFDKDSTNFSLKLNAYDRSRIYSTDSFILNPLNKHLPLLFFNCKPLNPDPTLNIHIPSKKTII